MKVRGVKNRKKVELIIPIIFIYPGIQISSILASLALRALVANIALIY
jgi:hypothetical protein